LRSPGAPFSRFGPAPKSQVDGRLHGLMGEGPFSGIVGQERAVGALEAAAARPVHAYLLIGPPGTGKRRAAEGLAAALLCPASPPDGTCESCRRVLAGVHPDVIHVEREGAAIGIDTAREVIHTALTSPVEGARKVVVLHDFHLVRDAAPALLKTIEEPPATTVFVILAEHLPPDLVTIASRCVQVEFQPLTVEQVAAALESDGVPPELAAHLAEASGGRLDRARLLASDRQFEARRQAWREVPARLDGTGATAAAVADELMGFLESSVEPLKTAQAEELKELTEGNERAAAVVASGRSGQAARAGGRATRAALNAGVKSMEERHKREQRRQRTDELRFGLGVLAGAYSQRLRSGPASSRSAAMEAVGHIDKLSRDLTYNPGELLAVQALLVRLGRPASGG
jgi:DNA polymerase III subunit delta'